MSVVAEQHTKSKTKTKRTARRGVKVLVVAGGLALIGGTAFAFWTQGGAGTGTAATGTTTAAIVVNQNALTTPLAPGIAAQQLTGTFSNSNSSAVKVTTINLTSFTVTKATGVTAACTTADYTVTGFPYTVNVDVPANSTNAGTWGGVGGPSIVFKDSTTVNQDGCKGATLTLNYTSS